MAQESRDCEGWYNSLNHDESGALRQPTLSAFNVGRETFNIGSDGQTTVLHVSSLQVRFPQTPNRNSSINRD